MRKLLIVCLLSFGLAIAGCTAAQVQTAEKDLTKVLQVALVALDNVAEHPETVAQAEAALSALAAIAPQTGPAHQAIVDAQAALNALQKGQAQVGQVQMALQTVISLLEQQGVVPVGSVRHGVAPVGSK